MVRDTLDPFSATVYFFFTTNLSAPGGTLRGVFRRETNPQRLVSPITISQKTVGDLPLSLRIERAGSRISLQRSDDGVAYTEVGQREIGTGSSQINLRSSTLVGLAVSGSDGSAPAIFGEVSGPSFLAPAAPTFHRGDPNSSGTSDISDGISIFGFLFLGEMAPDCRESADANNDGTLDISDGVFLLAWLFMGGPEPPAPGPTGEPCGPDSDAPGSPGDLGCLGYPPCR